MKYVLARAVGVAALALPAGGSDAQDGPRAPAKTADSRERGESLRVRDVLYARPFVLEKGYRSPCGTDTEVRAGYVLVLEVRADPSAPRESQGSRVLYVDGRPAERADRESAPGRWIGVVTSAQDSAGLPDLDLTRSLLWLGAPQSPPRSDAAFHQRELELASQTGARPLPGARWQAARTAGGAVLRAADRNALQRELVDLTLRFGPAEQDGPFAVQELIYARPFVLDVGYTHSYRAEKLELRAGYILVLRVGRELALSREVATNVLYVGRQTAERVTRGNGSDLLIAVVPAPPDERGRPALDLERTIAWFGARDLPSRVDARDVEREHQRAIAGGIRPLPSEQVLSALARGGDLLRVEDGYWLRRELAELILRYVPEERATAEGFLAPLVK